MQELANGITNYQPGPRQEKFSLVLDSSQITLFLECAQKWYNQYYKRLEPVTFFRGEEAMNAGTYGHKLLDIYYRARVRRLSLNDAVELCFAYDPDKDTCECGCAQDLHHRIELLNVDECTRCKKCLKFRPRPFPLSEDLKFSVRNRFREYCFQYQNNDFMPDSEQHVEVGFSEPIFEDAQNLFVLEGRMDLLGTFQGLKVIVDHKFQMRSHWLYPKSIQFKNYSMIAQVNMMIINYVRLQKSRTPDSLARDIVSFNPIELAAWKKRLVKIYFDIKKALQSGQFDKNWGACSGSQLTYQKNEQRYCFYTQLCEETDPRLAELREKQLYKIKDEVWRPW